MINKLGQKSIEPYPHGINCVFIHLPGSVAIHCGMQFIPGTHGGMSASVE